MNDSLLITGGCGFIGANFVHHRMQQHEGLLANLDSLTYAGHPGSVECFAGSPRYRFTHGDIADRKLVGQLLREIRPSAIINFAAESHVDRSILGPDAFINTNISGTFALLEEARAYWEGLASADGDHFRFLHVSTDEVYGSLGPHDAPFSETHPYQPNSPYSASKAASDHLVRAYHHTYGLPTLTTNCSNNYGPYQFPEKLIPLVIHNALAGKPLPIYGDGSNIRDWLYVQDHCAALSAVLQGGQVGQTYNIGGDAEAANLDVVGTLCDILDRMRPQSDGHSYQALITFVTDRPGHDQRYAIDASKIRQQLQWQPTQTLASGFERTVRWYLDNEPWVRSVTSGEYRHWLDRQYHR